MCCQLHAHGVSPVWVSARDADTTEEGSSMSVSPMGSARVLVVTPYYKESQAVLLRCIESVRAQSVTVDHL